MITGFGAAAFSRAMGNAERCWQRIASSAYSVQLCAGIVLAPTLGPVLGGWLSDHWGWRWIFFLNIPCGIAGYLLNRALQPEKPHDHTKDALKDRASYFSTLSGDSRTDATVRALGWIHERINRQALLLCYIDCFRLLMYVSLALSPIAIFFAVRKRPT